MLGRDADELGCAGDLRGAGVPERTACDAGRLARARRCARAGEDGPGKARLADLLWLAGELHAGRFGLLARRLRRGRAGLAGRQARFRRRRLATPALRGGGRRGEKMRTARPGVAALAQDLPEVVVDVARARRVRLDRAVGVAQESDERVGRAVQEDLAELVVAECGWACENIID